MPHLGLQSSRHPKQPQPSRRTVRTFRQTARDGPNMACAIRTPTTWTWTVPSPAISATRNSTAWTTRVTVRSGPRKAGVTSWSGLCTNTVPRSEYTATLSFLLVLNALIIFLILQACNICWARCASCPVSSDKTDWLNYFTEIYFTYRAFINIMSMKNIYLISKQKN